MTVSFLSMLLEILPVLIAAILSALIWNFFFIPPTFAFSIHNPIDTLIFLLYFLISLINAVLTLKIKRTEKKLRKKEEHEKIIGLYETVWNSLSHELRTPISTILGAIDVMKENKTTLTQDQQQELLQEIDYASLRLNQLVENLLNMSRLESGLLKVSPDWCDIHELIYTVIQNANPSENQHIDFEPTEDFPLVKIDSGLISEALNNLVQNAIIHTSDNTCISIQVALNDSVFFLTVSDNGPGFPMSDMEKVFEKFYRLNTGKVGGTGLGLSIVKGFIEAHGGHVILENNENGGAKFTLKIPVEVSYINCLKHE